MPDVRQFVFNVAAAAGDGSSAAWMRDLPLLQWVDIGENTPKYGLNPATYPDGTTHVDAGGYVSPTKNRRYNPSYDTGKSADLQTNCPWTSSSYVHGEAFYQNWGSGCFAKDYGPYGTMLFQGGGDKAGFGGEVWGFDLNTRMWFMESPPYPGWIGDGYLSFGSGTISPYYAAYGNEPFAAFNAWPGRDRSSFYPGPAFDYSEPVLLPKPGTGHPWGQLHYFQPNTSRGDECGLLVGFYHVAFVQANSRAQWNYSWKTKRWTRGEGGTAEYPTLFVTGFGGHGAYDPLNKVVVWTGSQNPNADPNRFHAYDPYESVAADAYGPRQGRVVAVSSTTYANVNNTGELISCVAPNGIGITTSLQSGTDGIYQTGEGGVYVWNMQNYPTMPTTAVNVRSRVTGWPLESGDGGVNGHGLEWSPKLNAFVLYHVRRPGSLWKLTPPNGVNGSYTDWTTGQWVCEDISLGGTTPGSVMTPTGPAFSHAYHCNGRFRVLSYTDMDVAFTTNVDADWWENNGLPPRRSNTCHVMRLS